MDRKWEGIAIAAGIGVVAGMRSMLAPALVSRYLGGRRRKEDALPMRLLGHPSAPAITAVMAAGELVGDKMPFTPARTQTPSLIGRVASGALCGAAVGIRMKAPVLAAAAVGGAAALGSTFVMYHARHVADRFVPDVVSAVSEDALALSLGTRILKA